MSASDPISNFVRRELRAHQEYDVLKIIVVVFDQVFGLGLCKWFVIPRMITVQRLVVG